MKDHSHIAGMREGAGGARGQSTWRPEVTVAGYLTSPACRGSGRCACLRRMLSGGQYPAGMPAPEPRPADARGLPGPGKTGPEGPASGTRVLVAGLAGLAAGAAVTLSVGWRYGLLAAWVFAAVVFLVQVWSHIARMDPATTAAHAVREDSGRKTTDLLVVLAAVASLGAVAVLLSSGSASDKDLQALLSVGSVALAWASVHTMYTTRYARLYYTGEDGGIDFNEDEPPTYIDFAYLAFTIGMTFQVSDTDLKTKAIRATALRHALLSYLFGAIIVATTINLVAGLAK